MPTLVLGIETSCDETAAAVVEDGRVIRSNIISSQINLHQKYGGVVPELASRRHLDKILPVIEEALGGARVRLKDIDVVAVTYGPGLAGPLLVGVAAAKALAWAADKPLIGVNHLEGHLYANFLSDPELEPPFLTLIVSGGHTDLVLLRQHGLLELLGQTRDDAAGEAFDKVGRLLGLSYPAGPQIEALARGGNPKAVSLPRAYLEEGSLDFSFSGLKTAVSLYIEKRSKAGEPINQVDLAASFQQAVIDVLVDKTVRAARVTGIKRVVLAGGVAANGALRQAFAERAAEEDIKVSFPPPILCTDNGAMIAAAGFFAWQKGIRSSLELNAIASLELTDGSIQQG